MELTVQELADAQRRSEERLTRLEQTVQELADAQRRSEERLTRAEERLAGVEERLARAEERLAGVEERLAGVEERLARLEQTVQELAEDLRRLTDRVDRLTDKVASMDGVLLESDYARKVSGYFGRWLRRAKVVDPDELWDQLESHLDHEEIQTALLSDLVVRGRATRLADRPEVYLIVEISAVIDEHDVERAIRRAELFRRARFPAIPAVAGRGASGTAKALAAGRGVAMLRDGQESYWDEALTRWPIA
jgi:uncharacterized coiled-coil protein SlyX